MASYNVYDNAERPFWNRFASIAREQDETQNSSLDLWREAFTSNNPLPSESELMDLLVALRALPVKPPFCPRLFVSHRRIDKDYALGIAKIANDTGFEFWLDILDPTLLSLPLLTHLTPRQLILLTACVIEMGLINSTHVLAVMTQDTKGGEWVPYEYGRVREINNTSCWQHPHHTFTLPDYMVLGEITDSQAGIEQWLRRFPRCGPIGWNPSWPIVTLP